jgi:hypothetical protein
MKIKLNTLVDSVEALELLVKKEMKVSTAFKIAANIKLLNPHLKTFHEVKSNLMKKHFGDDIPGDTVNLNDNPDFGKEYYDLLDTELEIDCELIKKEWFVTSNGDEVDLSSNILITLDWLIDS